jgi:hypothetical protein
MSYVLLGLVYFVCLVLIYFGLREYMNIIRKLRIKKLIEQRDLPTLVRKHRSF